MGGSTVLMGALGKFNETCASTVKPLIADSLKRGEPPSSGRYRCLQRVHYYYLRGFTIDLMLSCE